MKTKLFLGMLFAASAMSVGTVSAKAADELTWNGQGDSASWTGTNNWLDDKGDSTSWANNREAVFGAPEEGDDIATTVIIDTTLDAYETTVSGDYTWVISEGVQARSSFFTIENGSLTIEGTGTASFTNSYIGKGSDGMLVVTDEASVRFVNTTYIGYGDSTDGTTATGTVEITGGDTTFRASTIIGNAISSDAVGLLEITGGSATFSSNVFLGRTEEDSTGNAEGTLRISGGETTFSGMNIGYTSAGSTGDATGVLEITGDGTTTFKGSRVYIGYGSGDGTASGTLIISGGDTTFEGDYIYVGYSTGGDAVGAIEITGGKVTFEGTFLYIGYGDSGEGTASGSLSITDGEVNFDGMVYVGSNRLSDSSEGTLEISGGSANFSDRVYVGATGQGTEGSASGALKISDGDVTFEDNLYIGYTNYGTISDGTVEISGGDTTFEGAVYVGYDDDGTGSLKITDGYVTFEDTVYVGYSGAEGSLDLEGGTVEITKAINNEGTVKIGEDVIFVLDDILDDDGSFTLVTGSGTVEGLENLTTSNFEINGSILTGRSEISIDEETGEITITSRVEASDLIWNGTSTDNVWTTDNGGEIWVDANDKADYFYSYDNATFADGNDVNKSVVVSGKVEADTVTVTGSGYEFTFGEGASLVANTLIVDGGELTITEGTTKIGSATDTGNVFIGYGDEGSTNNGGSLTIYGGTTTIAKNLVVGAGGLLTIGKAEGDEGTAPVVTIGGDLAILGATGTIGSVDGTGGSVSVAGVIEVTYGSEFEISGGTVSVADYVLVGGDEGYGSSTLKVSGGTVSVGNYIFVYGDDTVGKSSLEITGGKVTIGDENESEYKGLFIEGSTLTISGSDTQVDVAGNMYVNTGASATISGGSTTVSGSLFVGYDEKGEASTGTLTITGGSVKVSDGEGNGLIIIGEENSSLSVSGGSLTTDMLGIGVGAEAEISDKGSLIVSDVAEIDGGKLTVSGGEVSVGNYILVYGDDTVGESSLEITGGKVTIGDETSTGEDAGLYVQGSTLSVSGESTQVDVYGDMYVNAGGSATIEGGTVSVSGGLSVGYDEEGVASSGSLTVSDGSLSANSLTIGGEESYVELIGGTTEIAGAVTIDKGSKLTIGDETQDADSTETVSLTAASANISGTLEIVNGTVEITNAVVIDGSVSISGGDTYFGIVALQDGGTLTITGGDNGLSYTGISGENSKLTISGGETKMGGATSAVITEGATLEVTAGSLEIRGTDGVSLEEGGSFSISGGTVSVAYSNIFVDDSTLTISGGDTTLYYVALDGESSSFTISKANEDGDTTVTLGDVVVYDGTFEITGGTVTLTSETLSEDNPYEDTNEGTLTVGSANSTGGEFKMSGGTLTAEGITVQNSGSLSLTAGALNVGELTIAGNATATLSGGTLNLGSLSATAVTFGNGLTVGTYGTNTLELSANITLDGSVTFNAGEEETITITGTLASGETGSTLVVSGNGLVTIANSATLQNLTVSSGTLDLAGTIVSITGTTTVSEGAELILSGEIDLSNTITNEGTVTIGENVLFVLDAELAGSGNTYTLITNTGSGTIIDWDSLDYTHFVYSDGKVLDRGHIIIDLDTGGVVVFETVVGDLVWDGKEGDSTWVTDGAGWKTSDGYATVFYANDNVTFDDSATSKNVSIASALTAGTVTVTGAEYTFTFSDAGSLTASSLTIEEGGSLTIAGSSATISGAVTISGGTLTTSANSTTFSSAVTIDGGSLKINNSTTFSRAVTIDNGTITIAGGTTTFSGEVDLGYYGEGSITITDGSTTFSQYVYLGYYGEGTIEITGGEVTFTRNLYVGHGTSDGAGSGTLKISGGHTTIGNTLYIGYANNGVTTGAVEISGADTVVDFSDRVYVGEGGSGGTAYGSLKITDATATFTGRVDIAYANSGDASGDVVLTNASTSFSGLVYVGYGNSAHTGTASLTISGGEATFTGEVHVGHGNGSGIAEGTVKISDGAKVSISGTVYVGYNTSTGSGTGSFTISGNDTTVYFSGNVEIGYGKSATGEMTITGGSATFSGSYIYVGYATSEGDGSGKLTISGGSADFSTTVDIGQGNYGSGTVEITGGEATFTGEVYVGQGNYSTGELKIGSSDGTGGTATFSDAVYVGYGNNSTASLTISGGTTTFSSSLEIGHGSSSTASFTMTGGEVILTDAGTISNAGTITLSGGTLDLSSAISNSGIVAIDTNSENTLVFVMNDSLIDGNYTDGGVLYTFITDGGTITGWNDLTYKDFSLDGVDISARQIEFTETAGSIIYHEEAIVADLVWNGTEDNHIWVSDDDNTRDWLNGTRADAFYTGDNVTFGSDGEKSVSISGEIVAGTVTVSGESYEFSFDEGATLAADSLTITEEGSLTVAGSLTADSATVSGTLGIAGGSAEIGTATVSGTLAISGEGTAVTIANGFTSTSTTENSISVGTGATLSLGGTIDILSTIENTGTVTLGDSVVFVLNDSLTLDGGTTYTFITADGTVTDWSSLTASNFVDSEGNELSHGHITVDVETSGQVTLVAVTTELVWNGDADSSAWTTDTTIKDWLVSDGYSDYFANGDSVTFDSTAASKTVSIGEEITAGTITVTGAEYTFSFDNKASLAANTLIVDGGSLTITEGTTKIGSATDTGSVFVGYDEETRSTYNGGSLTILGGTFTVAENLLVGAGGSLTIGKAEGDEGTAPVVTIDGSLAIMWATGKISDGSVSVAGIIEVTYGSSLTISDSTVSVADYVVVGGVEGYGNSKLTISSGDVSVGSYIFVYSEEDSESSLTITGGKVTIGDETESGSEYKGLLVQGGTLSVSGDDTQVDVAGNIYVNTGASATIEGGSTTVSGSLFVGYDEKGVASSGKLAITGGEVKVTNADNTGLVIVGEKDSSLTVSGGSLTTDMLSIGVGATAEVSEGSLTVSNFAQIAGGSLTISGGTVEVGNYIFVYGDEDYGSSSLTISDGKVTIGAETESEYKGLYVSGSTVTISGESTEVSVSDYVVVGDPDYDTTSSLIITGGTLTIGENPTTDDPGLYVQGGTLTIGSTDSTEGPEVQIAGGLYVSYGSTATIESGSVSVSGVLYVGDNEEGAETTGSLAISGGSVEISGATTVSAESSLTISGTGSLKISGGLTSAGTLTIADSGKLELADGKTTIASVSVADSGSLSITGGSTTLGDLTSTGSVSVSTDASLELDGTIVLDSAIENEGTITLGESVVFVMNDSLIDESYTGGGVLYTFITNSGDGTIIDWHGLNYTDFTLNGEAVASARQLDFNTADGSIIYHEEGHVADLVWNGDTDAFWTDSTDTDDHQYWLNGIRADAFYDGDNVTFAEVENVNKTVAVEGKVFAGTITVTGKDYSFTNTTEEGATYTITADSLTITEDGSLTVTTTESGSGTLALGTATVSGSLTINDVTATIDDSVYVENGGSLTIANGSTTVSSSLFVGYDEEGEASTGTLEIKGGELTVSNDDGNGLVIVGETGSSLEVSAGSLTTDMLGVGVGATAEVKDNGSLTVSDFMEIADSGKLTVSGGEVSVGNYILVYGDEDVGEGSLEITGGSLTIGSETSTSGDAGLYVQGGTLSVSGDTTEVDIYGDMYVNAGGSAEIKGGEVTVSGGLTVGYDEEGTASSGSLTVSGGSLSANSLTIGGVVDETTQTASSVTLTGGTTTITEAVTIASGSKLTIGDADAIYGENTDALLTADSASVSGALEIVAGTAEIETVEVSGTLTASGGSLEISDGLTSTGSITVSGGTLSLDGTIDLSSAISNSGTITLGESVSFVLNDALGTEYEGGGTLYTFITGSGTIDGWDDITYKNFEINGEAITSARQISFNTDDGSIIYNEEAVAADLVWNGSDENHVWASNDEDVKNWTNGERSDSFYDGDNVTFTEDGYKEIEVSGEVIAGDVTVEGSGYEFSSTEEGTEYSVTADTLTIESTGSLTVDGDGSLTAGEADIAGSLEIAGSLTAGSADISGSLEIGEDGSLTVTDTTTVSGELSIAGDATLSDVEVTGSMEVSGGKTTADSVAVSEGGELELSGGETEVSGAVTVGEDSSLSVDGGASLEAGSASVSGEAEVAGTMEVTGALSVAGTMTVDGENASLTAGSATVSGELDLTSGETTIENALTVGSTGSLNVADGASLKAGSASVSGEAEVAGTMKVDGALSVSGTMTVEGDDASLTAGSATVSGKLEINVSGETETSLGSVSVNRGTLDVLDGTVGADSISITNHGSANFTGGETTVEGSVSVSSNSTLTVSDGGSLSADSVTVSGTAEVAGTLDVTGALSVAVTMTVEGSLSAGSASVSGELEVASGKATIESAIVSGTLTVSGGSLEISDGLTSTGSITVSSGTLSLDGRIDLSTAISNSGTITLGDDVVFVLNDSLTLDEGTTYTFITGGAIEDWSSLDYSRFVYSDGSELSHGHVTIDLDTDGTVVITTVHEDHLTWTGVGSNAWTNGHNVKDWVDHYNEYDVFYNGDSVIFADTYEVVKDDGSGGTETFEVATKDVSIGEEIIADTVTVTGSGYTFTFGGDDASLTANSLTLEVPEDSESKVSLTLKGSGSITLEEVDVDAIKPYADAVETTRLTVGAGTTLTVGDDIDLTVDGNADVSGTLSIEGGTTTISGDLTADGGSLAVSDGSLSAESITVMVLGSIEMTGGTLTAGSIYIGGTGSFSGGTLNVGRLMSGDGLTFGDGLTVNPIEESLALDMNITLDGSVTFNAEEGDITISGTLDGDGLLTKTGGRTLTVSGGNEYTGGTTISAGTLVAENTSALGTGDVAIDSGATLELATDGTFSNATSGDGTLRIARGTEVSFGADIGVKNVNVASGATLSGGATLTHSGATLDLAGNLSLDLDAGETVTFTSGGTVILENSATLSLEGDIGVGSSFTIVSGGTVLGDIAGFLYTDSTLSALSGTYAVVYDTSTGWSVSIENTGTQSIPKMRLHDGIGDDFISAVISKDDMTINSGIQSKDQVSSNPIAREILNGNTSKAVEMLNTLAPDDYAAMVVMPTTAFYNDVSAINNHLAAVRRTAFDENYSYDPWGYGSLWGDSSPWGFFAQAQATYVDNDDDNDSQTFDYQMYGVLAGVDCRMSKAVTVGVTLGYDYGKAKIHNGGGKIESDDVRISVFAGTKMNEYVFANVGAQVGYGYYDAKRKTALGHANGDTQGYNAGVFADVGMDLPISEKLGLSARPYVGLAYMRSIVSSFDDGLFDIGSFHGDSVRASIGCGLFWDFELAGTGCSIGVDAAFSHDFCGEDVDIDASCMATGSSFGLTAKAMPENLFSVGPVVSVGLSESVSAFAGYTFEAGSDSSTGHSANVGVRVSF